MITEKVPGFQEWLATAAGPVARISTTLDPADRIGACKARWGIGRMNFMVPPGLYAIGQPDSDAPVLVTADYKMSYDIVRRALAGRHVWLLVLETYGINVWCAAGKGTFGTGELVRRIDATGLARVVSHRRLILPILGAPGVAAHQVLQRCGFSVEYAAIKASDLPEYLDNGRITTAAMRRLSFTLRERLVLIPVEMVLALRPIAAIGGVTLLAGLVAGGPAAAMAAFLAYLGAVLSGIVLGPLLLPWLPGPGFAVKGAVIGLLWTCLFYILAGGAAWSAAVTAALFLALPAVSAFYTLNFTGCSPYTSRSGVRKEMSMALPAMGCAVAISIGLLLIGRLM
ncbi:hypothetical protein GSbR_27140 [Geobacter sp. SVR]|nr:hypothetical protein GSVR_32250 [Geobacter sp. SVR]GCF86114.1 hypothetical protein GSbR_27140 [Geobacter sp. SVR]